MNGNELEPEIGRFFQSYTQAFERSDAAALAGHFIYPCQIVGENTPLTVGVMNAAPDYVAVISRFLELYRKAGVVTGRILDFSLTELSPRLVSARLHWQIANEAGAQLYEFAAIYTLAKGDDGWRITAIAHNELPRLQKLLGATR